MNKQSICLDSATVTTCLGQLAKSFLYPSRSIKCITDENGQQLTCDVLVLLENIDIEHPVGQYVCDVCQSYVRQYKTGGAYLLYFISSWSKAAQLLCDMGIPSAHVIDLLSTVVEDCIEHTSTLKVKVKEAITKGKRREDKHETHALNDLKCQLVSHRKDNGGVNDKVSIENNIYASDASNMNFDVDGANNVDQLTIKVDEGLAENWPDEVILSDLVKPQKPCHIKGMVNSETANRMKEPMQDLTGTQIESSVFANELLEIQAQGDINTDSFTDISGINLDQNNPNEEEETIDGIKIVRLKMEDGSEQEEIKEDISWFFQQDKDTTLSSSLEQNLLCGDDRTNTKKCNQIKQTQEDKCDQSKLRACLIDDLNDVRLLKESETKYFNREVKQFKMNMIEGCTLPDKQLENLDDSYESLKNELTALKIGIELDIEKVKQKKQYRKMVATTDCDEFSACFEKADDEFDVCFDSSVKRSVISNGISDNDITEAVDNEFQEISMKFIETETKNDNKSICKKDGIDHQQTICLLEQNTSVHSSRELDRNKQSAVMNNKTGHSIVENSCDNGFQEVSINESRKLISKTQNKNSNIVSDFNTTGRDTDRYSRHDLDTCFDTDRTFPTAKTSLHTSTHGPNVASQLDLNEGHLITESIGIKPLSLNAKPCSDTTDDDEFESSFDTSHSEKANDIKIKVVDVGNVGQSSKADNKAGKITMHGLDSLLQGLGKATKKPSSSFQSLRLSSRHLASQEDTLIIESKKVLSASEIHRHLEPSCTQPSTCENNAESSEDDSNDVDKTNEDHVSKEEDNLEHTVGLSDHANNNCTESNRLNKDMQQKLLYESFKSHRSLSTNVAQTVKGIDELINSISFGKRKSKENDKGKTKSNILLRSRHFGNDELDIEVDSQIHVTKPEVDLQSQGDVTDDQILSTGNRKQDIDNSSLGMRDEVLAFVTELNFGREERFLNVLTDVVMTFSRGNDLCLLPQYVQVCGLVGGYREPVRVDGILIKVSHDQAAQIHRFHNQSCRVLLVNADIKSTYKHKGYKAMKTTKVYSADSFAYHVTENDQWKHEMTEILEQLDVHVVLARGSISEDFQLLCDERGVVAMECVPYQQLSLVCEVSKITMVTYLTLATEVNICKGVSLSAWEPDIDHMTKKCVQGTCQHAILINLPNSNPQTIVLHNHIQTLVDLEEEAFMDNLHRTASALSSGCVIPGAGATEISCADMCLAKTEKLLKELDRTGLDEHDHYLPTVYSVVAKSFQEYARLVQEQCNLLLDRTLDCVYDDYNSKVEAWRTALDTVCILLSSDMFIVTGLSQNQNIRQSHQGYTANLL